jgi:hypothetical protein
LQRQLRRSLLLLPKVSLRQLQQRLLVASDLLRLRMESMGLRGVEVIEIG